MMREAIRLFLHSTSLPCWTKGGHAPVETPTGVECFDCKKPCNLTRGTKQ